MCVVFSLPFPADLENEEWGLGSELTSAAVKTEPAEVDAPGLAPSGSLTVTPASVTLDGREPQLQGNDMVLIELEVG